MRGLPRFVAEIGGLIMPKVCHLCGNILSRGESAICTACLSDLPRTLYHHADMNPMEQRFAGFFPFVRATGYFFYAPNSSMAKLVQDFKYRKFPSLARRLGFVMGMELFPSGFFSDVDLIMPIPMHWFKQSLRGYNQTHLIAEGVADATGIPVDFSLKACQPHKTQTSLSHEQRLDNTKGIFSLSRQDTLRGKHLLILDDICTTGATLRSAASFILDNYNNSSDSPRISLLSLGVTQL